MLNYISFLLTNSCSSCMFCLLTIIDLICLCISNRDFRTDFFAVVVLCVFLLHWFLNVDFWEAGKVQKTSSLLVPVTFPFCIFLTRLPLSGIQDPPFHGSKAHSSIKTHLQIPLTTVFSLCISCCFTYLVLTFAHSRLLIYLYAYLYIYSNGK